MQIQQAKLPIGSEARELFESRPALAAFALTIFLGAFLLFQVELLISKYVLPWFGGSAAVWTTTMLFFQTLLFVGYAYAHALSTRCRSGRQWKLHLAVVAASLIAIVLTGTRWASPLTPGTAWKPQGPDHPVLDIVLILLVSVGLPFFLLSSAGPLLQSWYVRTAERSPYRLYAVSNLGSLLGLLSYPFLVEPLLKLRTQSWVWSAFYAVFCAGVGLCVLSLRRAPAEQASRESIPTPAPSLWRYLLWLSLAGCASVALLAVTNLMSQYVAAVPLLWVIPLSLYLVSFIICFGKPRWYTRGFFHALYPIAALATLLAIASTDVWMQMVSCSVLLFAICMVCHGELARLKPPSDHVTSFYLSVSGGGALGGIFVGIVAPALFSRLWEFHLAIVAPGLLLGVLLFIEKDSWLHRGSVWIAVAVLAGLFLLPWLAMRAYPDIGHELQQLKYFQAATLLCLPLVPSIAILLRNPREAVPIKPLQIAAAAVLILFAYSFPRLSWGFGGQTSVRSRNFYGILEVQDYPGERMLLHGKTVHGAQWKSPALRRMPSTYYGQDSGIGQLLRYHPKRDPVAPMRIGIVGLGTGALAAYGLPGDYIRFYELDPGVPPLVQGRNSWFSYLDDSQAKVDVILGDARLSLEREAAQNFDVLVLDAFNGDAVPVHLLTLEAMQTYLNHLVPDGVVAVHISTSALDLSPVLLGSVEQLHLSGTMIRSEDSATGVPSVWVLLTRDAQALRTPGLQQYGRPLAAGRQPVVWTDDYSNVISLFRR